MTQNCEITYNDKTPFAGIDLFPGKELTEKQHEANALLGSSARHILLRGGSRSGKTFLFCRAIILRALKANGSTHSILREHFNHLKHSIIYDTMPKVVSVCFPALRMQLDKSDWYHLLPNGSKILYGGLDDKERTEKILGQEHSTIMLNECSRISYGSRNKAVTRLAQNSGLKLKMYYDENPPNTGHWSYPLFILKIDPNTKQPLANPENYATLLMNPIDNIHLSKDYIQELDNLPERDRKRFRDGEFLPQVSGALWNIEMFKREQEPENDKLRKKLIDRMRRIVVSIDPSGCSGPEETRSDEVGITVAGVDNDGFGYLLEDASGHYSPETWGRLAVSLYNKWEANTIIGEINYGGDMVRAIVHGAKVGVPFKKITASRGKHVRADPVSALYEKGRIIHVGPFNELEDQYMNFSTSGYQGDRSPDRADSSIFAFTELMLDDKVSRYTLANVR